MHHARWTLFAVFFVTSAGCFAQEATPASPAEPDSAAPLRDPHSNAADLTVPMCPAKFDDSLATDGIVGNPRSEGAKAPIVKHSVVAEFTDEARKLKKKGQELEIVSTLRVVVSVNGNPENICLVRSAGYGLDFNAADAVRQYQFVPATKQGKPVAARITIEVDFRDD